MSALVVRKGNVTVYELAKRDPVCVHVWGDKSQHKVDARQFSFAQCKRCGAAKVENMAP